MAELSGAVSGSAPGPFVFSNTNGGGELVQEIQLGGKFSFDVSFAMEAGSTGMAFGWALFDTVKYLGVNGDLGNVFLQPGAPIGEQITYTLPANSLSSVTVIPEPSTAALMFVAMLAALAVRRRGGRRY